ncbi:hypothetical protein HRR83_008475 [Exophiala dermatitidis]|uniref:Uncharacterized protein n=1 Tax=Exophiala dermatitidis TaxID=5970 RepID=A0AAN6IU22_EXODE|nr:hypothetical protein HRR73_008290 [Exophiala dermatitidis]KAJ4506454.1 hypothetical protein HRR74_008352 [Exophiala dermatitidis]KAJ4533631.1 hypothetical protein HRR77_008392 [Exophiala dermatitidis]KAJ4547437.1 hypothetical protein HRR76_000079 [Exophiala dermatitidis]KAJ4560368.1 hypothetical protein HRR79_008056 [Exophiala dermatitidis]
MEIENKTSKDKEYQKSPIDTAGQQTSNHRTQRPVSLYDVVAGRVGQNGFLTEEQSRSQNVLPLAPEDVLLRSTRIPAQRILDSYDAVGDLPSSEKLPDSELLKAVHAYASDCYSCATREGGRYDYHSLDETALIAVGILLEEAVRGALGENGDMVFVEPEGLEQGLEESKMVQHQVQGRVKRPARPKSTSDEDSAEDDESPMKRRRQ